MARVGDWDTASGVGAAPDTVAQTLATRWEAIAQLEHASVASFARFTLELLGLGAPPDLVAEAQRSALDEVEHARVAFGLATHFGGQPVGPGPLPLAGVTPQTDPAQVLGALLAEGCVGETFGAALAAAQARDASDPALAAILNRVAADEARHAAFAWRCAEWIVGRWPALGEVVVDVVASALAEARTDLARGPGGVPGWGAPGPAERDHLLAAVARSVNGWAAHLATGTA